MITAWEVLAGDMLHASCCLQQHQPFQLTWISMSWEMLALPAWPASRSRSSSWPWRNLSLSIHSGSAAFSPSSGSREALTAKQTQLKQHWLPPAVWAACTSWAAELTNVMGQVQPCPLPTGEIPPSISLVQISTNWDGAGRLREDTELVRSPLLGMTCLTEMMGCHWF